jgi:hypothetical protein
MNNPMRLEADLTAAARRSADAMSRSLSQQIAHWARIGRELERTPGISAAAVQRVLAGKGGYDTLNVQQQAVVRVHWAERMDATRKGLRLDKTLADKGREVVELDAAGEVVVKAAKPRLRPLR